jgi:hypothetical protein
MADLFGGVGGMSENVRAVYEKLQKSQQEAALLQELSTQHQRQMAQTQMRAEIHKGYQNLMNLIAQNMK